MYKPQKCGLITSSVLVIVTPVQQGLCGELILLAYRERWLVCGHCLLSVDFCLNFCLQH